MDSGNGVVARQWRRPWGTDPCPRGTDPCPKNTDPCPGACMRAPRGDSRAPFSPRIEAAVRWQACGIGIIRHILPSGPCGHRHRRTRCRAAGATPPHSGIAVPCHAHEHTPHVARGRAPRDMPCRRTAAPHQAHADPAHCDGRRPWYWNPVSPSTTCKAAQPPPGACQLTNSVWLLVRYLSSEHQQSTTAPPPPPSPHNSITEVPL